MALLAEMMNSLMIIAGEISFDIMSTVFDDLEHEQIKIKSCTQFKFTKEKLNEFFFDTPASSITKLEMAEMNLLQVMEENEFNYALIIEGMQKNLDSIAKQYKKNNKYYFTVNKQDFNFKIRFFEYFDKKIQHEKFWKYYESRVQKKINSTNKNTLNNFKDDIDLDHQMEMVSYNMPCCCFALRMYNTQYWKHFFHQIKIVGINQLSKNKIQQAIERHINIDKGQFNIEFAINIIYNYIGYTVQYTNDKIVPNKYFECPTCKDIITINDKPKSPTKLIAIHTESTNTNRCAICNCYVSQWSEHIQQRMHRRAQYIIQLLNNFENEKYLI